MVVLGNASALRIARACVAASQSVLLRGGPGVGKTTAAKAICREFGLPMRRLQGTADTWPSDILGTTVWNQQTGEQDFIKGPVFTSVLLVDEFNRIPPRSQSALIEAIAERQVSANGTAHELDPHFLVIATENHGTSSLYQHEPAVADRFAAAVILEPIGRAHETELLLSKSSPQPDHRRHADVRRRFQHVRAAEPVVSYLQDIFEEIRSAAPGVLTTRSLIQALDVARGLAALDVRDFVTPDDVREAIQPCVQHRTEYDLRRVIDHALAAARVPTG